MAARPVAANRPDGGADVWLELPRATLSDLQASAHQRLIWAATLTRRWTPSSNPRTHAADPARATPRRVRLRRVTGGAIAVTVALGGVFATFAAGSTHTKKTIVGSPRALQARCPR